LANEQKTISPEAGTAKTRYAALLFPVLLGAYLLVTSTIHLSDTLWQFDAKRMLQLYLLPALFLWVLVIPSLRIAFSEQTARIPRWMGWALTLMFTLGVISAWYNSTSTMGLAYSLADVALLFLLIAAALAIAACRKVAGEVFDRILIVLVAMVGVAVGLQELIGVLAAWNVGLEFHPHVALQYFSWPRFYNQVQAWSMPVIAALPLLFPGKPLAKLLCVISLALHWYVVIATGARGAAVGVIFAILIACVLFSSIRKPMIRYQMWGLIAGVLIYVAVVFGHYTLLTNGPIGGGANENLSKVASTTESTHPDQWPEEAKRAEKARKITLQKMGESTGDFMEPITGPRMWTSSGRMAMWRGSIEDTKSHPALGIGPMNYACKGPLLRPGHPHSFPLQFLSEWGAPAFLLLLAVGAYLAFALIRVLRQSDDVLVENPEVAGFLAIGILSALILSGLDGVFVMPASQVTGVLITGWFLGSLPFAQQSSHTSFFGKSVLLTGLTISCVLLSFAAMQVTSNIPRYEAMDIPERLLPRFWQYGKDCRLDLPQTSENRSE
jgi:hypothetical protein